MGFGKVSIPFGFTNILPCYFITLQSSRLSNAIEITRLFHSFPSFLGLDTGGGGSVHVEISWKGTNLAAHKALLQVHYCSDRAHYFFL